MYIACNSRMHILATTVEYVIYFSAPVAVIITPIAIATEFDLAAGKVYICFPALLGHIVSHVRPAAPVTCTTFHVAYDVDEVNFFRL